MKSLEELKDLVNEGKIGEAVPAIIEFLNTETDNPHARYLLGVCYFRQKKFETAEELFRQSLRVNSKNFGTAYYLGLTLERMNRLPEAKYCYEYTAKFNPTYAKVADKLESLKNIESVKTFESHIKSKEPEEKQQQNKQTYTPPPRQKTPPLRQKIKQPPPKPKLSSKTYLGCTVRLIQGLFMLALGGFLGYFIGGSATNSEGGAFIGAILGVIIIQIIRGTYAKRER